MKNTTAFICLLLAHATATAANFSFSGEFTYDNDVQAINFTVDQASTVSMRSWSYAGGVNANGDTIARGGFDPGIALFDGAGMKVAEQDDASCALTAADALTEGCWDIFYSQTLAAGSYTLTIMQYHNVAYGGYLADGFLFDGVGNRRFRDGFVDDAGDQRTGFWAMDLLGVADAAALPASVPEPGSLMLVGLGAAAMAAARRRRPG